MSLIGYVTLEEANQYVESHYLYSDELRQCWEKLTEEDSAVLLNKSFQALELLPFTGRKLESSQTSAFPRYPYRSVPEAIKWAQIENALSMSNAAAVGEMQHYERLKAYGVKSYTIGNLSETTEPASAQCNGILSAIAERMLQPFMGGGYRI